MTRMIEQAMNNSTIEVGRPVRALAQDHVEIGRSRDTVNEPLYTPYILCGRRGRLIASYEYGNLEKKGGDKTKPNARIATSDDGGRTWIERAREFMTHGRLFKGAGDTVYYLGSRRYPRIMRSDDNGTTWGSAAMLINDRVASGYDWYDKGSVWYDKGRVYLGITHRVLDRGQGWPPADYAPVVMRGRLDADLTKVENWTFSDEFSMAQLIPGFESNRFPWDYFGVPFYPQRYPACTVIAEPKHPVTGEPIVRDFSPIGFLEPNLVKITDPEHFWYDPTGKTYHILARMHTGGTGYAALLKAVEQEDGSIKMMCETVPSGKKCLFIPLPGGQMYFHICYDPAMKLYWLASTQATNSMTRVETMTPDRMSLPYNERQRLVLHYSKNLIDWCFAGLVAKAEAPTQARHYASMDIDGDDLVLVSRSGDRESRNAHDGNIVTFHRIRNFRELVY